jgi:hypothetical protein
MAIRIKQSIEGKPSSEDNSSNKDSSVSNLNFILSQLANLQSILQPKIPTKKIDLSPAGINKMLALSLRAHDSLIRAPGTMAVDHCGEDDDDVKSNVEDYLKGIVYLYGVMVYY